MFIIVCIMSMYNRFFFSVLYSSACVTRWFDSDDPETNGRDSELLSGLFSKYPGYICPNPIGIEVQTISGQPKQNINSNFVLTSWFDRDDPDDPGDSEILTDIQIIIPPKVCSLPIAIEVTTISGSPALLTGNLFQLFDPLLGFKCVNEQQGGGVCQDYKVRYTCPKSFCKIQVLSNLTIEATNILDKY
uniref:WxxW domain-containing protein n=1 Tax=Sinocyclocheilus grahami TaxID=75366 RepID=A0A672LIU0_SINGR